jgi:hypothetical protein
MRGEAVRANFDRYEIEENKFTDGLGDMQKLPRMAWRHGLELHLFNLKSFVHDGKDLLNFGKRVPNHP